MTASTDPDRRYLLPPDAPYIANLAALWSVDPALAARIEAVPDADCYSTEPARSGDLTVAVPDARGQKRYLHSRYQPVAETRRLLDGIDFSSTFFFYIHGFGLGYLPKLVFEAAGSESVLCVFENDLRLLKTAFFAQDLSALIRSRRVLIHTSDDKAELFQRLTPYSAMTTQATATLRHAPTMQLHPQFHENMASLVEAFTTFSQTNITTLVANGKRTAENIAGNLGWYVASPCLSRLKDRHAGRPAIIVSAGPSLRKNKHLLIEAQDRAVIIAVQTTLQPLLEMGVEPHYVTSLDYHDICTRFFEKLPRTLRTHLVAEPKASTRIFPMYPGPVTLLGNDFADGLIREMGLQRGRLAAGATVAHLAFYLAEHLGCDPVIFIGQDLGFSDGLCYTPGTSYEDVWQPELGRFCTVEMKQWEQIVRDRQILRRIPDYQGRPMYTEQRLYTYLQQFERDFARTRCRVIDATEGGAYMRGSQIMTLREALDRHCTTPVRVPTVEGEPMRWDRLPDCIESLRQRFDEARQIEDISRQTLPLLHEVRDHLTDQGRVNRAIARIDPLRARMSRYGRTYALVMQLTQKTELDRFHQDRAIAATAPQSQERQRRQIERDISNVEGVLAAAGEFQRLMHDVIERLANEAARRQLKGAA